MLEGTSHLIRVNGETHPLMSSKPLRIKEGSDKGVGTEAQGSDREGGVLRRAPDS